MMSDTGRNAVAGIEFDDPTREDIDYLSLWYSVSSCSHIDQLVLLYPDPQD